MAIVDTPPAPSGRPPGDPVAVMRGALDVLAGESRDGWSGAGVTARVREIADVHRRVELELVRIAAGWDAASLYGDDAYLTALPWLIRETGMGRGPAMRLLDVARLTHRHDHVAAELFDGTLSLSKATSLARVDTEDRRDLFIRDLPKLLAVIAPMDNDDATRLINYWARLADDELGTEPADARSKRHLFVSRTFEGMVVLDGLLDPETASIVLAALDALDEPDAIDGHTMPRTPGQRRADNLAEMARRSLTTDGHLDPDKTVNVIVGADLVMGPDLDTDCTDTCADDCPGHAPRPRPAGDVVGKDCEIVGQGPINPKHVHKMLCDSWISRVVMGADGTILDLGRRKRLFTPAQRRAIIARDKHCVVGGCRQPPDRCQVHHTNPWEAGGETNIDDGCLACWGHHHLIHDKGWILRRIDGRWHAIPPA